MHTHSLTAIRNPTTIPSSSSSSSITFPTFVSLSLSQNPLDRKGIELSSQSEQEMAAKFLLVLFAACFVPAIVTARFVGEQFLVKGAVYCDTCRCGYETDATKYMAGATVQIECRNRDTAQVTYTSPESKTDSNGKYTIKVENDFGDDYCDAFLVKSSDPTCSTPNEGRDRARVILTRNNGMTSNIRHANNMGFLANTPLANCAQILMKYQEADV